MRDNTLKRGDSLIHWRVLFSCRTEKRGEEYCERGLVSNLEFDGDKITATVRGKKDYAVTIYLEGSEVDDMDCTCPHAAEGHCCKHMAAVLAAYDKAYEGS